MAANNQAKTEAAEVRESPVLRQSQRLSCSSLSPSKHVGAVCVVQAQEEARLVNQELVLLHQKHETEKAKMKLTINNLTEDLHRVRFHFFVCCCVSNLTNRVMQILTGCACICFPDQSSKRTPPHAIDDFGSSIGEFSCLTSIGFWFSAHRCQHCLQLRALLNSSVPFSRFARH